MMRKRQKKEKRRKNGEEKQCHGKIPTSNIALKWWHKTNEMATDDVKIARNCTSDKDRCKTNNKMPTGTGFPPSIHEIICLEIQEYLEASWK